MQYSLPFVVRVFRHDFVLIVVDDAVFLRIDEHLAGDDPGSPRLAGGRRR